MLFYLHPKKNTESGFTLLELIIVMILSALILGLVSIYLANFSSSARFQATIREFTATIRQARNLSKLNGDREGLSIDLDRKEYGLAGRKARTIPADVIFKVIDPTMGEIITGKYLLSFEPNGTGDNALFQISNKKKTVLIGLDPVVGTVVSR